MRKMGKEMDAHLNFHIPPPLFLFLTSFFRYFAGCRQFVLVAERGTRYSGKSGLIPGYVPVALAIMTQEGKFERVPDGGGGRLEIGEIGDWDWGLETREL